MYILKIKLGEHQGKYVGRKRSHSWDWKPTADVEKARIFSSIGGVKSFFGKVYGGEEYKVFLNKHRDYIKSLNRARASDEYWKQFYKDKQQYRLEYTAYYELIPIQIKGL